MRSLPHTERRCPARRSWRRLRRRRARRAGARGRRPGVRSDKPPAVRKQSAGWGPGASRQVQRWKLTRGSSNRPSIGSSRHWLRLSSRKFPPIKRKSLLAPQSRSGTGMGRKQHTKSWGSKRQTLNAHQLVGFRRWRGRCFCGERVTRFGFARQQAMRNWRS